jgi:hypothetical protein
MHLSGQNLERRIDQGPRAAERLRETLDAENGRAASGIAAIVAQR